MLNHDFTAKLFNLEEVIITNVENVCVNQSLAEIKPMPSGNSITASTHRKEGS